MSFLHDHVLRNFEPPFATLMLQLLVIMLVARACGALARRLAQPQVIGSGVFRSKRAGATPVFEL